MAFLKILCKAFNSKILDCKNLARKILQNFMCFIVLSCAILGNVSYADYNGRLPYSITLNDGTSQSHNAIASCTAWDCTFGYINGGGGYDFTYSTNGNADSTLTLNATLPQNPPAGAQKTIKFYIGNATLNPHSNLILNNFESVLLQSSLNLNNATMKFNATSATSTFQIQENASVTLNNNATLEIKSNNFTNYNELSLHNSTLSITAQEIFSYKQMQNNNGTITVNGNFYNVGQKSALGGANPSSIATLTNNGGNITIKGSFYNGWQKDANLDCRISICGGGILINNGGTINIQGQLISERKGGQNSSISIYGGTLSATGGVQNLAGSTLTIGADSNGKMGQIVGNLTTNGEAIIDANGANAGNHTLITGTLTGSISLKNGNTQFASSNLINKTLTITLNQDQINHFNATLTHNQATTLNALGNRIYTTNGATSARLTTVANALNSDIFNLFVSMPFAITDTLKSSLHNPATNASNATKSKSSANALEIAFIGNIMQQNNDIDYSFLGGSAGLKLGYTKDFNLPNKNAPLPATLYLSAGYLYANAQNSQTNTLSKQNSRFSSHAIGLNASFFVLLDRNKRFGFRNTLGGVMAFMSVKREVDSTLLLAKSTLDSSPNLYLITLDSVLNYELLKNPSIFSLSPYFGLSQSINILPSFAESTLTQNSTTTSSQIALKSMSYNSYHLGLLTGLGAKFALSRLNGGLNRFNSTIDVAQKGILSAKVEYEYLVFASQKAIILQYQASQNALNSTNNANSLHFGLPHSHKVGVNIGFAKDFANGVSLGFEALFKAYLNPTRDIVPEIMGQNLFLYGANIAVGYRF